MNTSLLAVFDSIENFLETISEVLKFDILMWVFLGIFVLLIVTTIIRLRFTYEVRAIRSFKKINKYFLKKPYINESNLVEFNRLMKKIPYQLRDRWQFYMLNREGLPSQDMTLFHCVEQPIKTSNYKSTIVMLQHVTNICVVLCLILSFFALGTGAVFTPLNFVRALIIPAMFYILCQLYIYFLNAKFNANSVDLYEYYLSFIRNLDKASASIPDYVDYELLFTDKEIRDGIPVLREYLEKRAVLDKIAREKAKRMEVERENFDFSSLDIDGSLLVERAMTTSQDYLNSRNRLRDEIMKLETQKDNYNEQYISVEKDNQKKLQAIKENLARLQTQLESSANRIESNYIKKQQDQEKAKQIEIEKNLEDLHVKYAQQIEFLETEINNRKDEIEKDKQSVTEQMDAEFKTYNEKVYTIIRNEIDQNDADALKVTRAELDKTRDQLAFETQEKENLNLTLDIRNQEVDTLQSSVEALNNKIAKLTSKDRRNIAKMYDENIELKKRVAELEAQMQPTVEENGESINEYGANNISEVTENQVQENDVVENDASEDEVVYYDENGNPVDFSQYYDEEGRFKEFPKVYDKDGNYYDFADYYDVYGNPLNTEDNVGDDDGQAGDGEGAVANNIAEENNGENLVEEQLEEANENQVPQEENNFVATDNSQEYDVDRFGEGENVDTAIEIAESVDEQSSESQGDNLDEVNAVKNDNVDEPIENTEQDNDQYDDDVVYYDENGKPVDFEQYYDEEGKFKEFPKVYDKDGNFYDFADYYDRDGNLLDAKREEINEDDIIPIDEDEPYVQLVSESQEQPLEVSQPTVTEKTEEVDAQVSEVSENAEKRLEVKEPNEEKVEEPPKRKRGRPRKDESQTTAETNPKRRATKASDEKADDSKTSKTGKKKTTDKKTTAKKSTSGKTTAKTGAKKTTKQSQSASKSKTTKSSAKSTAKKQTTAKPKKTDEDLDKIAGQIDNEQQKQADLKNKITQTLSELQEKPTVDRDLEEIKSIIKKLKDQAVEVNKNENGLSKEEQKEINKQINKSLSELLLIMANKSKR